MVISNRCAKDEYTHNAIGLVPSSLDGSAVGSISGGAFEFSSRIYLPLILSFK
jgi:hypothetical protein